MRRFEYNETHLRDQFRRRYKRYSIRFDEIFSRVRLALESKTPEDWRFTESPASRFFVVEEETGAKFLGLSYRRGNKGIQIVQRIRNDLTRPGHIYEQMEDYVRLYIEEVNDPGLPIIHHIRTVLGKKTGDISQEKELFNICMSALPHTIPLMAKKVASRPNAIVTREGELWVRQYMNWVSPNRCAPELYLFHPLEKTGVNRSRFAIFSYTENGVMKKLPEACHDRSSPAPCDIKQEIFQHLEGNTPDFGKEIRSESYWKVPTFVDRRLTDLEYKTLESEKHNAAPAKKETISSDELLEDYFLKMIVSRARKKLIG